MQTENNLNVKWSAEKLPAFLLFLIFCSFGIIFTWGIIGPLLKRNYSPSILFFFALVYICISFAIYYFKMTFGKSELFEITEKGIKILDDEPLPWDCIYEIQLKTIPPPGLGFLYFLMGPKGLYFYQIIIYEDFLLEKKRIIKFTSQVNTNYEKVNELLSYYSIKNNIVFN